MILYSFVHIIRATGALHSAAITLNMREIYSALILLSQRLRCS
jgi:hypothetical protein